MSFLNKLKNKVRHNHYKNRQKISYKNRIQMKYRIFYEIHDLHHYKISSITKIRNF